MLILQIFFKKLKNILNNNYYKLKYTLIRRRIVLVDYTYCVLLFMVYSERLLIM